MANFRCFFVNFLCSSKEKENGCRIVFFFSIEKIRKDKSSFESSVCPYSCEKRRRHRRMSIKASRPTSESDRLSTALNYSDGFWRSSGPTDGFRNRHETKEKARFRRDRMSASTTVPVFERSCATKFRAVAFLRANRAVEDVWRALWFACPTNRSVSENLFPFGNLEMYTRVRFSGYTKKQILTHTFVRTDFRGHITYTRSLLTDFYVLKRNPYVRYDSRRVTVGLAERFYYVINRYAYAK